MESFIPGQEYGRPYRNVILVCINDRPRSFEQCNLEKSRDILTHLQQLQATGKLGSNTWVASSGCMLGCKPQGATVTLCLEKNNWQPQCFRNVTEHDLMSLLEQTL